MHLFPGPRQLFSSCFAAGEIELELMAQGVLCERLRAQGAGIPAFFTTVGGGDGGGTRQEKRGEWEKRCILETALGADFRVHQGLEERTA